jgi:hypothetical protein
MRRALLTVAVLGLAWTGYMAWPVYDLLVLVRAIETRDVESVVRHVYFDAVRMSLTNQVVDAYVRRTGIQIGPLRRNIAAAAIANPVVGKTHFTRSAVPAAHRWLAGNCGARWTTTRYDRNNNEHDWDHLADFWEFRVWLRQVRSRGAGRLAAAATLPS